MAIEPTDAAVRDVYLNLVRAHEKLHADFATLFREHGLTSAQYNVLRILIGASKEGASCQYIGGELLNRVPDVTRLIDRMEGAGLVKRLRSSADRRVVLVRITARGRKLCERLDEPVMDLHRRQLAHLPPRRVTSLNVGLVELLKGS